MTLRLVKSSKQKACQLTSTKKTTKETTKYSHLRSWKQNLGISFVKKILLLCLETWMGFFLFAILLTNHIIVGYVLGNILYMFYIYCWWGLKGMEFSVLAPESRCFSGVDFRGVVRFGVVTNRQVAEAISLQEDETVYLHRRFNSSLVSNVINPW